MTVPTDYIEDEVFTGIKRKPQVPDPRLCK